MRLWGAVLLAALKDVDNPDCTGSHVKGTKGYANPHNAAAWFHETAAQRDAIGSWWFVADALGLDADGALGYLESTGRLPVAFGYLFLSPERHATGRSPERGCPRMAHKERAPR